MNALFVFCIFITSACKGVFFLCNRNELDFISQFLTKTPTVLEAGANDGSDTVRIKKKWPNSTIYAFEPVPELYQKCRAATRRYGNVNIYQLGLSDKTGKSFFFLPENPSRPAVVTAAGSLLSISSDFLSYGTLNFGKKITIQTTTLDDWAQQVGVNKIDMIWFDLQGYELNVLKASPVTLKTVMVIYLEVEFKAIYEGQYLWPEVKTWLKEKGFELVATDFDVSKETNTPSRPEDWFGNAIFVRKGLTCINRTMSY